MLNVTTTTLWTFEDRGFVATGGIQRRNAQIRPRMAQIRNRKLFGPLDHRPHGRPTTEFFVPGAFEWESPKRDRGFELTECPALATIFAESGHKPRTVAEGGSRGPSAVTQVAARPSPPESVGG